MIFIYVPLMMIALFSADFVIRVVYKILTIKVEPIEIIQAPIVKKILDPESQEYLNRYMPH